MEAIKPFFPILSRKVGHSCIKAAETRAIQHAASSPNAADESAQLNTNCR